MTLNKLLMLSGALSLMAWTSLAQHPSTDKETNAIGEGRTYQTTTESSTAYKSIFATKDTTLLADNVSLKNKKRVEALNKEISKNISEELAKEALMYPAVELYGSDSWNNRSVNPFAGGRSIEIPDTFNIDCTQFVHPIGSVCRINSHYGYRRRFGRMHYGIDLKLNVGDTVRAAFDGKVRLVSFERRGYGNYVVIRHPNGLETVYGHLSRAIVKPDQIVRAGDPIALGGNTGRSTGPHLHFETRFMGVALNPESIIDFTKGYPLSGQYVFHRRKLGIPSLTSIAGRGGARISQIHTGDIIKTHKIRRGDTLAKIASRYGVSVGHLCRINGISTHTKLRVGRSVRIS